MPEIVCNLCGARAARLRHAFPGRSLYVCDDCGLAFIHPQPENAAELYGRYYLSIDGVHNEVGYDNYFADRALLERSFAQRLELLERHQPPGRLFELGCAAGFFLDLARRRGWSVGGVELCAPAAAYARDTLGLDVCAGTIEDAELLPDSLDAAALNDTIEHLPDPAAALARISAALKPGGVLLLTTPDFESPLARLMGRRWIHLKPEEHLFYFGRRSVRRLFAAHGLQTVLVQPLHKPRSPGGLAARLNFHLFDNRSSALDRLAKGLNARLPRPINVRSGELLALARKPGGA